MLVRKNMQMFLYDYDGFICCIPYYIPRNTLFLAILYKYHITNDFLL